MLFALAALTLASVAHAETPPKVVLKHAAKATGCSEPTAELVGTSPMDEHGGISPWKNWQVEACGETYFMSSSRWLAGHFMRDDVQLHRKAAFDLGCEQVEFALIDASNRGAVGCGGRVSYTFVPELQKWVTSAVGPDRASADAAE